MKNKQEIISDVAQSFYELGRSINQSLVQKDQFLTPPQFFILYNIFENGKSTVSTLGKLLGLTSGATTIAVNRLVDAGFLNRYRDDQDRRIVWLDLTDAGKQTMADFHRRRNKIWEEVFEFFTYEEVAQFLNLLKKIKRPNCGEV